jgi:hypothetical protein
MSNGKKRHREWRYFTSQDKSLIAPPLSNDQAAVEEIVKAYRQHKKKTSDDVAFDSMQEATPELNVMESDKKKKNINKGWAGYNISEDISNDLSEKGIKLRAMPKWLQDHTTARAALVWGDVIYINSTYYDINKEEFKNPVYRQSYEKSLRELIKEEIPHVAQYRKKGKAGFLAGWVGDIFNTSFKQGFNMLQKAGFNPIKWVDNMQGKTYERKGSIESRAHNDKSARKLASSIDIDFSDPIYNFEGDSRYYGEELASTLPHLRKKPGTLF